ncbi:uncharacterized [Tachysurus ichikawai]
MWLRRHFPDCRQSNSLLLGCVGSFKIFPALVSIPPGIEVLGSADLAICSADLTTHCSAFRSSALQIPVGNVPS